MDKKQINKAVRDYLFATAMTMFKYDGLPDNVRPEDLERLLLENGELISPNGMTSYTFFSLPVQESRIIWESGTAIR